jgi:hypothetical protein
LDAGLRVTRRSDFVRLNEALDKIAKLLDDSCDPIKELDLNPKENIRRIGQALGLIFEIQFQIWDLYPELESPETKARREQIESERKEKGE